MKRVDRAELVRAIRAAAEGRDRILVALAGPPGAGKSTLAEALASALGAEAAILPMDGFHLDNSVLIERGLLDRKGSPPTFDREGFAALLERVKAGGEVPVPVFDRAADSVVENGGMIPADARIILVEGNYLLLNEPGWRDLSGLWDLSVMLDVSEEELERRLVDRWLTYGYDPERARARALRNDIPNMRLVKELALPSDYVLAGD